MEIIMQPLSKAKPAQGKRAKHPSANGTRELGEKVGAARIQAVDSTPNPGQWKRNSGDPEREQRMRSAGLLGGDSVAPYCRLDIWSTWL